MIYDKIIANPYVVRKKIEAELESMGISPLTMEHSYRYDFINITFTSKEDMMLYNVACKDRTDTNLRIICVVKE